MTNAYFAADLALPAPNPLYLRYQQMQADTQYSIHQHPWGQLSWISLGIMDLELEQQHLIAPANYLIWVPADIPHSAYVRQALNYTSIYVSDHLAQLLPKEACLLTSTPLIGALISDFGQRQLGHMQDQSDQNQAELLITRLSQCKSAPNFLPSSSDTLISPILKALQAGPDDARSLSSWASEVHSTERTLARRFQSELGMSFGQCRNRIRVLHALAWLKEGKTIQDIAWQLGYSTPSAFIAMFKQLIGFSPERYRQQQSPLTKS
ncbi:AraC family transcriptional regulator [Iodobacter fluviatilis]|uniref:AraC family transcriptional regulator n=1 Tax=Iodobacter fluviatilis TaxID=537 RepID=A0A377SYL3_9NEIS|nr:helix-turn-helix transcriptional regulator [Iodobacter fluviatilis]TCU87915.1 AraC family transcriptional regulator [Iodobacter fluviatilis]STR45416.1 L-rhamnose operon transcriptional activator rhaR [Iodobacter fluviatilis]